MVPVECSYGTILGIFLIRFVTEIIPKELYASIGMGVVALVAVVVGVTWDNPVIAFSLVNLLSSHP
jgi:hypothetical protein